MSDDWDKPSKALKRMAEAPVPPQFRQTICPRGHFAEIECDDVCASLVMRFDWDEVDERRAALRSDVHALRRDLRRLEQHLGEDS